MKRVLKIILAGIGIGVLLIFFQRILHIDEAVFVRGYWIAAPGIVIGAGAFNLCYNLYYLNQVKKSVILLDGGQAEEYIDRITALLKTAKGQNLRNILLLNLAAGYVETKQFDRAIPMLEELSAKRLKGSAVNMVHKVNLCMSYFETEQYEKAMEVYERNQVLFQKYRQDSTYGGYIVMLDVAAAIMEEQYERAEKLLDTSKEQYDDSRLQKAFGELQDVLRSTLQEK